MQRSISRVMDNKILVTGIGVISAIGNSVSENLSSLRSAKSGIGPIRYLETEIGRASCRERV